MKNKESVQAYMARVFVVVSQMRSYGEIISDEIVVAKVLRSLTPNFDRVVSAIDESKYLSKFSFNELMGSLQAHEARINRSFDKEEENAFHTKGEPESSNRMRGRDRGSYRGRGRGRTRPVNTSLHCSHCNKYGNSDNFCWYKPEEAKFAEENDEEEFLFMNSSTPLSLPKKCVRLGDRKQLQIERQGTAFAMKGNHTKQIKDVHFALSLAHNLINVGQLMENGCSVLFYDNKYVVKQKATSKTLAITHMTQNRMFLLSFSDHSEVPLVNKAVADSELWHLGYGHLNIACLQFLKRKEMVSDLPNIVPLERVCEGCVIGKQAKKPFLVGKSKRATQIPELIHVNLCGPMRTESLAGRIVKDVEVHIGKLKLLNDLYVIDIKKDLETPLRVGRGFLATANTVIDCRMAKIAMGEGITRESYKPRPRSDGVGVRIPYYARKDFLDCHLPREWEIAKDIELNPFKDTLVIRRMEMTVDFPFPHYVIIHYTPKKERILNIYLSYNNTPSYPLSLFSSHKRHQNNHTYSSNSNPPLAVQDSDDIVINSAVLKALEKMTIKATSTTLPTFRESPFQGTNNHEDGHVDESADKFIRRFYNDLRLKNKMKD
uniref:Retrovirus-related Pol polyprotein from transposon TNT 1-94 n=1 Tax=Tanacetum cinerariifolium TaxID=118510 RepID=A0A6L2MZB6_TANCI|nr:retrovirus-related Pol polyprotein from transposon TNT 1-94 [Tanacetum cinerariifolium]